MLSNFRFFSYLFTALLLTPSLAQATNAVRLLCNGSSGFNGNNGFGPGGSAPDGYKGFSPGGRGGDGQRGSDGGNASAASAGGNACPITVLLEKHPTDATKLIYSGKVGARDVNGVLDLDDKTSLTLTAVGGRGGDGARGADGQDGGRGGEGGDAGDNSFSSGDGGRGGDGGAAGESTNGANGGNGGRVVLQLRAGQESLANYVHASVVGGTGGNKPFAFVRGGRGGQGGQPGNNCYFSSEGYKCVGRGMTGMNGMDGRAPFGQPQSGSPGQPGSFSIQVIQ